MQLLPDKWRLKLAGALLNNTSLLRAGRLDFWYSGNSVIPLTDEWSLYVKAFLENDIIFSVQDWKSSKVAAMPPLLFEVKDKKSFARYRRAKQQWLENSHQQARIKAGLLSRGIDPERYNKSVSEANARLLDRLDTLKKKSLEAVESHDLLNVLARPNPMQRRYDFMYALTTNLDVVGNTLIYGKPMSAGLNKGQVREMWILPPASTELIGAKVMQPPTAYRVQGVKEPVAAENVLHLRRFNLSMTEPAQNWWGRSRLVSLKESVIHKYKHSVEAELEMLQNRGPRSLVFPKGATYDEMHLDQASELSDYINEKLKKKGRPVQASTVELGTIRVGVENLQDLNLIEGYNNMLSKTCGVYHLRPEVVANVDKSTYNNLTESRKISLTDGVLPDAYKAYEGLNEWFVPGFCQNGQQLHLEPDQDYFPELQEDRKAKAEYLGMLPLTPNQVLSEFDFEEYDHELMNVPFIRSGSAPVTDFEDKPEAENDGSYEED